MSDANGLRLLLVARLSRKKTGTTRVEGVSIEIQDGDARAWAEHEGHAVIGLAADIKTGTSAPWKRKNLKPWMTDPAKLAMYDALLIYRTDRISRGTQEDFTYIEHWAVSHGKRIIVADGPRFPKRDDSDYWRWTAEKDTARKEWEAIRARQMATQTQLKKTGKAVGRPPFGYGIEGETYDKRFTLDPVTGPLAVEAFQRISDGRTATSVAEWLTEQTGQNWRVKRVIDMIKRRTYLGERDGHKYTPLVSEDLWNSANTVLAGRSIKVGGRSIVHAYSGLIYCECGAPLYRHQSVRKDKNTGIVKNTGIPKYRCAKGRRGIAGEKKCEYPALPYDAANQAVDAEMRDSHSPEWVMVTTGGDYGRQSDIQRLEAEMNAANARKDRALGRKLSEELEELEARPSEPIRTIPKKTGQTIAQVWDRGSLTDQRALLGNYKTTVFLQADGTVKAIADDGIEGP